MAYLWGFAMGKKYGVKLLAKRLAVKTAKNIYAGMMRRSADFGQPRPGGGTTDKTTKH